MRQRLLFTVSAVLLITAACTHKKSDVTELPALIPMPQSVAWYDSTMIELPKPYIASFPQDNHRNRLLTREFNKSLMAAGKDTLSFEEQAPVGALKAVIDSENYKSGEYVIHVTAAEGVQITAGDEDAIDYAVQTLRQLITPKGIPTVVIHDEPRFAYRGHMLDESRHIMGMDYVKRLLDEMQYYKLNTFHWHLVDAGGWRLQIEQYPELTDLTAYRTESDWNKWWIQKDRRYTNADDHEGYGGFYTRDEIREIVQYALDRGITVIPEIEMPGHSEEVLHAYPQLSCSGKALPHESDFCVGNPDSFRFLENVLTEVMSLFPGKYIHIGGDEAGKTAWKTCPKCQALMRQEGMKSVDELQSYMITRMEEYLNEHDRSIIGWDEILEGGLAPNATVMSWRGEEGGRKAAESGHDVIMSPNSHFYIDYYQENPTTAERKAIGGYLPLQKCYSYDPVPEDASALLRQHVIGVQANLWTEYVDTPDYAAYMTFPRLLALAEVGWTLPENKDWDSFVKRTSQHISQLQARGMKAYNLSNNITIDMDIDYDAEQITVGLTPEYYGTELRYTLDGTMPTPESPLYNPDERITVQDSALLVVAGFVNGERIGSPIEQRFDYHRGIGHTVEWQRPLKGGYPAGGEKTALLDGIRGSFTYMDQKWLGSFDALSTIGTIDLGEAIPLTHVLTRCMHDLDPWVHMPKYVELSLSNDGKNFTVVDRVYSKTDPNDNRTRLETFHFYPATSARYLRIEYRMNGTNQFLFTDELVVW